MFKELPKVSVIIPHYNMHALLPDAVKSVAHQDYENIELIIVDDGSDRAACSSQIAVDTDAVKLLKIAHGGKARAVNHGFHTARENILPSWTPMTSCRSKVFPTEYSFLKKMTRIYPSAVLKCIIREK